MDSSPFMQWLILVVGLLGGGIVVKIYEEIRKQGKISLNEYYVKVNYQEHHLQNYLMSFDIDLLFINASSYQMVFKINSARFYDGEKFVTLVFNNYNTLPAGVLPANDVKCFQYNLHLSTGAGVEIPIVPIAYDTAHIEISYAIGNKKNTAFLQGKSFTLINQGVYID